jgi:rod shape-determining protein MreC
MRFNGIFAFLILESICLYLYFTHNTNPEKAAFLSSANTAVGGVYEVSSRLWQYWNLSVVNDSLARENARLKMQLPNSQYNSAIETAIHQDSLYEQQYRYTGAMVVNNSLNKSRNFLTINRGSAHGIKPGTGVVNALGNGVVGIVRKVSTHYASVMSVLNRDIRISAKILRNEYFGILIWDGNEVTHMNLDALPKHADLRKGDTIITSGYSTIFPKGILIGTVDTFLVQPGSNFYTARVRLFNNMGNVQQVYVVEDLHTKEKEALKADER